MPSPTHFVVFLQKDVLMHRWRYPSLSFHGIEGAFSGSGAKTVIPRKVVGKFSIRLVPDMTPEVVSEQARGARGRGEGVPCVQRLPPGLWAAGERASARAALSLALASSAIAGISSSELIRGKGCMKGHPVRVASVTAEAC